MTTLTKSDGNISMMKTKVNRSQIPVLSFFTGAGFLDMGFMHAGFNIAWRNEYSRQFISGFEYAMDRMGFSEKISNCQSIADIGPNQVAKEAFSNTARPGLFGMIGGPPCPDFSVGGKNRGSQGDNGRLTKVYVSRILELQPSFFLLENVPGLIRTAKHRAFLHGLVLQLHKNYALDINIANALDYGVPQDRSRVFIIGIQKKLIKGTAYDSALQPAFDLSRSMIDKHLAGVNHWFPWEKGRIFPNAKTMFNWPSVGKFGGHPTLPAGVPAELTVGPLVCDFEATSKIPNGLDFFNPYSKRFKTVEEGDVSRKSFKRLHRWRYSPAAAYGNNEVHLHPTLPRRLSVREALRIQTAPDAYELPPEMPLSHKFKTIGNGVPVRLAHKIASTIFEVMGELV